MFKKTLLASALTLFMATATQGVQANPISNMVSGFLGDAASSLQFDARRGGGSRHSAPSRSSRPATTVSSRSSTSSNRSSQSSSASQSHSTSQDKSSASSSSTTTKNNQQDAQFSQNAYKGNTTNTPNQQPMQPSGGMGMGSNFISSLAGAGAGVLLANMLLSPSAAAAQGTEVATPDMLSDDQLSDLLAEVDGQIRDAEARLLEASGDDVTLIRDEISQLNELKISVMKEQLNRLQNR